MFEWVKFRSHLSRGVTVGTMLQDEALHFLRIGTFLERADNTARLLDVKFQSLAGDYFGAPATGWPGGEAQEVDFYHWSAVLRSVSGFEVYRKVYRNVIRPDKVAELLILRPDMPRSLAACVNEVLANLTQVANAAEQRDPAPCRPPAQRPAVRPHRRDPGHRAARLPDAVPRPCRRPGCRASAATSWCRWRREAWLQSGIEHPLTWRGTQGGTPNERHRARTFR